MWFKALVSVACVAVIGFVAFYSWDRYTAASARQEAEDAEVALFQACSEAANAYRVGQLTAEKAVQLRECKRVGIPTGLEHIFD
ncbi:hypothetical protein [Aureimonas sp. AU22]|uniref:hypothetical protein n=1 Tax=Aureimonas sp. AU22 TaxID=1638162 RepID=UPI000A783125|nr:hypothetical protein [Aureimonas sp. AU22]